MKTRSNRGAINFVAIGVILLAGYAWHQYSTVFAPGRDKKKADAAAAAAVVAQQQAVVIKDDAAAVKAAVAQSTADHVAVIAKRDVIDQNSEGFSYAAHSVLLAEPNPTPGVKLATTLTDSAYAALGANLSPEQKAVWDSMLAAHKDDKAAIAARDAKISQMTADAIAMYGSLEATQAHAKASDEHSTVLAGQLAVKTTELVKTTGLAATLTGQVKAWADKEPDWIARIKALGILCGLLAVGLIWYEIRRRGLAGALTDAVALKEHVQATAVTLGADATKLEQSAAGWWGDATKDLAKFNAVKAKLRQ